MRSLKQNLYMTKFKQYNLSLFITEAVSLFPAATIRGEGGHSHYGGDADVRLQRPLFSVLLSPNDPILLLIVSAVTEKPHIF